jgi:UrcA family protein
MTRIFIRLVAGLFATTLVSGVLVAQDMGEIKVTASRAVETKTTGTELSSEGWIAPIVQVSLSSGVGYAGLDLTSDAGAAELEKRVKAAARAVCKELSGKYPNAKTTEAECAKVAAANAMVKVHELTAAAGKKPAK